MAKQTQLTSCYLLSFICSFVANEYHPTVLVHGIASSKSEMVELENYLTSLGVPTYNIEIGNGELTSIFMSMNDQCDTLAEHIKTIPSKKINIIAISQGGLLARCYIEKYVSMDEYSGVNMLLTMGTPHMGIFNSENPDPIYKSFIRDYWKDPFEYNKYLETNKFLAELNNERGHKDSELYKTNFVTLNEFIIVWSSIDNIIEPYQSAKFEFYNTTDAMENRELDIVALNVSNTYSNDLIGLRTLDESNRFHTIRFDCQHDKFKTSECFIPIIESVIQCF